MLQIPNFNSIKLCLSICGYDGLISDIELETLYSLYNKKNGITRDQFAHKAAGSDGLDIRENIALKICTSMLTIKED